MYHLTCAVIVVIIYIIQLETNHFNCYDLTTCSPIPGQTQDIVCILFLDHPSF